MAESSGSCVSGSAATKSSRLHQEYCDKPRHRRDTGTQTDSDADDTGNTSITMDGPPLASLSLTHVHYDPTSRVSHACAFLALVPQALCIAYATFIYSSREIEILIMFAGQMACEGLNWVLKRYIREDRPAQMLGKGYGMPSSHAQFVAFFAVYLGLWVVVRHDPWKENASKTHVPTPMWQRVALALAAMTGAVAVAQSRIHLNYHTPRQVYIGFAVGSLCAVAWFIVTSVGRHCGMIDSLLDFGPLRWLRMRDLLVNEDMVDAGWERWEATRLRRRELFANSTISPQMKNR
ncbi:hypothetical protein Q7P37_010938 [Cladosporium fusiforme]